ncbi:MAG: Fpg/Nei family DNA glycosylase [Promethearchaeota archaeon]
MPELPDLEVAKDVLNRRVIGRTIEAVELFDPIVLRRPVAEAFQHELQSRTIQDAQRYGKFLILLFTPPARLYINFMLVGHLAIQPPSDRIMKSTGFRLHLSGNIDLRYYDGRRMGKIYLLLKDEPTSLIPTFDEQGPDALDPALTLDMFRAHIRKFNAQIKRVLKNQGFIAGIGNAYSNEILYEAHINPFRKRSTLTPTEIDALYSATKAVLHNAITTITTRSGDNLHFKIRDFLQVHGKSGQPCPRCKTQLTTVKDGLDFVYYCRKCQV